MGTKTLYLKHGSGLKIISESFEGGELKPSIKKEVPAPEEGEPVRVAKEPGVEAGEPQAGAAKKVPTITVEEMKPVLAKKEPLAAAEESKPSPLSKEPRPAEEAQKDLKRVVETWKKAWEQRDLAAYMSFYDAGFQSRGMNFKAWKKHREKLNQKYRSIKVGISNLTIEQTSAVMASVSFTQRYEADDYGDEGHKSLLFIKKGKDWKIREEEWKPLDQESRP